MVPLAFENAKVCDGLGACAERTVFVNASGRISESPDPGVERVDCGGGWLVPGLVDIHVHGAMGRDTMEADAEAYDSITQWHAAHGTTSLVLTTVCAPWTAIHAAIDAVRQYRMAKTSAGSRVLGVHVEGPYFSPEKRGAHAVELLRRPLDDDPSLLLAHADVVIRTTIAPELPGAVPWIEVLGAAGIATSIGHSDGWDDQVQAAISAGARQATHLYNCMSAARKRGDERIAGVVEVVLGDPRVTCELIADGHHVSKSLIRLALQAKRPGGLVLVSDASAGAGLPHGAFFALGEMRGEILGGRAVLEGTGVLAGSTSTVIDGVRMLVQHCGVALPEAVAMASGIPARTLGLETEIGSLTPGACGDLVLLDADLSVQGVWIDGCRLAIRR